MATIDPKRLIRPLRVAGMPRLAGGYFVSRVGDWLTSGALVGWVYGSTHSAAQVALLLAVRLLPGVVGGGLAAALVDRLPRTRMLVSVELARAAATALLLGGVLLDSSAIVLLTSFVSGVLAASSGVASRTAVPALVDEEQLPAANALLGMAQEAAMAVGALCAGTVLVVASARVGIAIDLVTFFGAAFLYRRIPTTEPPARRERGRLRQGFLYVLRRREVSVVVASFAGLTVATGLAMASFAGFLGGELGLGGAGYGFGLGAVATGLVLGEALAGAARLHQAGPRAVGVVFFATAGLFGILALARTAWLALALLALVGVVEGFAEVLYDTLLQRLVEPEHLGRAYAFANSAVGTTMLAGTVLAPLVASVAAPHGVILVSGLCLAGAGAIALLGGRSPAPGYQVEPSRSTT